MIAFLFCAALTSFQSNAEPGAVLSHDIDVSIDPEQRTIELLDRIDFGQSNSQWKILLDAQLSLSIVDRNDAGDSSLSTTDEINSAGLREYALNLGERQSLEFRVQGTWPADYEEARGRISKDGVYLPPHGGWMPIVADTRTRYRMAVTLPPGWVSVSQGQFESADDVGRWSDQTPQPGVWLIAGHFYHHKAKAGDIDLSGYFFESDPALAERYFDSADIWLKRYSQLLGAYPYSKLALVENFWESGYGMPSFALLGSKVIRLPFIAHTAWPHEILHNWFGNGVYPANDGNWSEGLTAYLADHAIRELAGEASAFRRDTLQKFHSFVSDGEDFPLTEFRFRHDNETAAIGYDKALMVFHMLRMRTGDQGMVDGLRKFIADFQHDNAGWKDIQTTMSEVTGEDLAPFFNQWLNRTGVPRLALSNTATVDGCATGLLEQTQTDDVYELQVPVFVSFEQQTIRHNVQLTDRKKSFSVCANGTPGRIIVDPQFDVFRELYESEIPPSVSELIGRPDVIAIIPSAASETERKAWQEVVSQAGIDALVDNTIDRLPDSAALWIMGSSNFFARDFLEADGHTVRLETENADTDANAMIVIKRQDQRPIGFASVPPSGDALALMRRVRHYGRYSFVAFQPGDRIASIRGQWPVSNNSPLSIQLTPNAPPIELPKRNSIFDQASE